MHALYAEKFRTRSPDPRKIAAWSAEADKLMAEQKQYIIKDDLWEMYMRNGGTGLNASTGQETTGYYVTLPSNKVELQMLLEADRMRNAVFREFYSEKEVVREERRLSENQPGYFFREQLNAAFFAASPYAWSVIGWDVDLQKVTRQDMIDYKNTYYVPNNAVAVYVGDIRAEEVIRLAERRFGPIPRGRDLEPVRTTEPKQYCEKRILGEAETAPSLSIMYHIPPEGHPDDQVFRVLSGILSGTTGRLHKKLVNELDIALNARAFANSMTYAGAFLFMATPNEPGGHTPSELEEVICAEIERLKNEPVTDYELQKVKNQAEASFVRQLRSNMGLAFQLGRSELGLGWREISRSLERMREVSAEDVQRVANETFTNDNRTVGVLLRKKSESTRRPGPPRNPAKES